MQKFIITSDGAFRFGDVSYHKDLLRPGEYCIGGGWYEFDYVGSAMRLYGKSYDFGRPKWADIDELRLPSSIAGLNITYEDLPLSDFVKIRAAADV